MPQQSCLHAGDLVAFCESVLNASAANTSANASNFTLLPKEEWLSGFPHGKPPLLQAHIYCMFLAAPLWFATAAVTAFGRFKSWWLQIHISLALSTLVVTLSGIACVVMHIESEGSGHFRTTHHYAGITLGALLLLHVLLGAARPKDPGVGARDIYGKVEPSKLSAARRGWHMLHMATGFPVLGSLFMFQVLYSGHVTLHGYWAFPLNVLFFVPVMVLKARLESGAAELKERLEEGSESMADTTNPISEQQSEELVVCPDITANIEWLFANQQTGALSTAFLVAVGSCAQFIPHMLVGSFMLPGLGEAYEARDPLMCMGLCFLMVFTSFAVPIWLVEVRRSINPVVDGGPGYLKQLGVGTLMITARQARSIHAAGHFHPYNPKGAPPNLLPPIVISLFVLSTGWGARSEPWMNRLSAIFLAEFMICARPLVSVFTVTLGIASRLAKFQVEKVAHAVRTFPTGSGELEWERWEANVVAPITQLVEMMQIVTDGWGRGMAATSFAAVTMILAQVCFSLSPMTDRLDHWGEDTPTYVRLQSAFFIIGFTIIPFLIALGPAKVSTACDDLKESLNSIRLANPLSTEIDERVSILEKCLTNVNRGQGIGFKVFDFVVDVKTLTKIALQLFSGVSFIAPILLGMSRGEEVKIG